MPLEPVPNVLDDATHARMDAAALETAIFYDPSVPGLAAPLLATIVSTSENLLDSKYENNPNAAALLREHPELVEQLTVAWNTKSFKAIRNLSTSPVLHLQMMGVSNGDLLAEDLRPTNTTVRSRRRTERLMNADIHR
jgi:hypothetical protein